jgi:excisionase family DNA binding protein
MEDESLTIKVGEAAKLLGISRPFAYQMAHEGKLPVIRFGKRMVVPKKAIEKMLELPETFGKD